MLYVWHIGTPLGLLYRIYRKDVLPVDDEDEGIDSELELLLEEENITDDKDEEKSMEEEMSDEDGSNEEIKVLNEEEEDSSQRQSSVVSKLTKMSKVKLMLKGLSILPVDDKDDSELELEDENREDNVDC